MKGRSSTGARRSAAGLLAVAFVLAVLGTAHARAQSQPAGAVLLAQLAPPIPPLPVGPAPGPSAPPGVGLLPPGQSIVPPPPPPTRITPTGKATLTPHAQPIVPAGQVALVLNARYGRETAITNDLHWRIYSDKPDAFGLFHLVKEDRGASPTLLLAPGNYVVHCAFGLATAVRRVQLRSDTVRVAFEIHAGGLRMEGKVGEKKIPRGQISFDIFKGSQFEPGENTPIATKVNAGEIVVLPEGVYHIVSTFGDANATVRSDIRVQTGKLTDVTINHRAARITLKLVSQVGGEALASTDWEVLTPSGDVITESKGAFPIVVLAEGEYVVIARNEGKVFNRQFKVEPGIDHEVEVVAR